MHILTLPSCLCWISCDSCVSDPLVSHGRHFCRTVHALCNIKALLTNSLLLTTSGPTDAEESFTSEYVFHYFNEASSNLYPTSERREYYVFMTLLQMVPGLGDRLTDGGGSEVVTIAEMVRVIFCIVMNDGVHCHPSCKEVHPAHGLMTQKV
jgi:hypothetical protein